MHNLMTLRRILVPVLTLVLCTATIGCHNSNTSVEARLAASPTPTALVHGPVATPTPAQDRTAPLSPIPVTPPATLNPEQLPQDGPVAFSISGSAGDVIVVNVKEVSNPEYERTLPHTVADTMEARYTISAATSDGVSAKTLQAGGDCTNTSMLLLPQDGSYQFVFNAPSRKWGRKYGLSFSTMHKNDPIMDVGLTPEQISIDFGDSAKGDVRVEPPLVAEGCLDNSGPAHLKVHGRRMEFRIMQVDGYKKVAAYNVFPSEDGIAVLQAALTAGKTDAVGSLPYAIFGDAGLNMWARQELLVGDGWRGLRWIGGYAQDTVVSPDLGYVFEGITDDGRFLIVAHTRISHPANQKRWTKSTTTNANTRTRIDLDAAEAKAHAINKLLEHDLDTADPASFQPSLEQLDAVVRSLKLKY